MKVQVDTMSTDERYKNSERRARVHAYVYLLSNGAVATVERIMMTHKRILSHARTGS